MVLGLVVKIFEIFLLLIINLNCNIILNSNIHTSTDTLHSEPMHIITSSPVSSGVANQVFKRNLKSIWHEKVSLKVFQMKKLCLTVNKQKYLEENRTVGLQYPSHW